MSITVTSNVSEVIIGQSVKAEAVAFAAPPFIPSSTNVDEFTVASTPYYNATTEQYPQVVGLSTNAKIEIAERLGTPSSLVGNFYYNIHPTQQLWSGNQGTRFYITFSDTVFGVDRSLLHIEWGWEPSISKGIIQVYDPATKIGEVQVTGYIPSGKQIVVQSFTGAFIVYYDGTSIASGTWPGDATKPLKIVYGTYKLGGQPASITWPVGHPAKAVNYPGWIFSDASTAGAQWRACAPTWSLLALNSSGVQIGSDYSPSSSGLSADLVPYAFFTVPNAAGIVNIRIRARYHTLGPSSGGPLGNPGLTIPVVAGTTDPLAVSGPNPVTLEPGQTYTVTANYPTSELTFLALGGGSFGTGATANVYTAPLDAGNSATYQFKVTRAASSEDVTVGVIVPMRLTPSSVSLIGGATQIFTANTNVSSWSSTGGSLAGSAARTRTYTAPTSIGTYHVTATAGASSATSAINVTSSGTIPTTGLRLEPAAGYSVGLNATPQVRLTGDISPAIWATVSNFGIDQATGNIKLQSNAANAEAILAQSPETVAGAPNSVFTWEFNSTQAAVPGDTPQYLFEFRAQNPSGSFSVGYAIFNYLGSGENWDIKVYDQALLLATVPFTRTDTTGLQVTFAVSGGSLTATVAYRASNAVGYTTVATPTWLLTSPLPRYIVARFTGYVNSRANGTIIFQKPTLTSGFNRWYPPQWQAHRVDGVGNILGSYPVTAGEEASISGTDSVRAQTAAITCNAVGTARVRASYPSGVVAQNDVYITIASVAGPLEVTSPAVGTTTNVAPGEQITVEANDSPTALTYSCPGGQFEAPPFKNVFTAGVAAGLFTLTVSRGSEVVTRQIRVLMQVTPASTTLLPNQSVNLTVNTTQAISVSATGGTVSIIGTSGGVGGTNPKTTLQYTAPVTTGTYTVNVTSSINNASASIIVVPSGSAPIAISNTEPLVVEPGGKVTIATNYPASEVTFSATGGFFGAGPLRAQWTAPALAENYTITVTHAVGGSDTINAFVPLRITPKNPPGIAPGQQIQFSANYATVVWEISSPAGGTINAQGLWTAGVTGGSYTVLVRATIDAVIYEDYVTVTIQGEGLALNIPAQITMQPGSQITITANFPVSELTFAATGGTFGTGATANVYTAPANAGVYTITVTRGTQTANVQVTVPVVITPGTISLPKETAQLFTVNADVVNFATTGWSSTGGALSGQAIRTATYTTGITAGNYTVTAITTLGTVVATITNTGTASVPIVITGPDAVTIEPSSTYLVTTNKPAGTYSLTATGGTFEGNQYRAPSAAGTYTITVTDTSGSGGGSDTLTVTVPLRITPANATVLPGVAVQFSVNTPSSEVSWDVLGGFSSGLIDIDGRWTGTITPGTYTITATTATSSATAQVTVQIVELVIYGPSEITLEPDSAYKVLTNYPARGPSYTAFGGSFTFANNYKAPHEAGNYYFTVSVTGQTERVDVHVPLRISPKEVRLEAGASTQFSINSPSATWSTTAGTVSQTGFYTAPASGGTFARVTATTPNGSDTAIVLFLDEFPYQPSYAVSGEINREAVLARSEGGRRFGRIKGPVERSYALEFKNRDQAEVEAAMLFWRLHYPELPMIFHDLKLDDFVVVTFDSALRWQVNGTCLFTYSFRFLEVGEEEES